MCAGGNGSTDDIRRFAMAQDIRKYNIDIKDQAGNFIGRFENVTPSEIISEYKISDGKYIDASVLTFEVTVDNARVEE